MADVIQRFSSLLSSIASTVGTAAVQISGGPSSNWPLTGVSASYYPNYHRLAIRIANTSPSATIYVGSGSGITAGAGGGWFKQISPGQFVEIMANGSVPIWIIATAAATGFTLEELS